MQRHLHTILILAVVVVPGLASAAAPDLLPPVSMWIDAGDTVSATGMDFFDHAQSGSVNFNPNNYDVHLPGGIVLPVQDVVAYNGVKHPIKDCLDLAKTLTTAQKDFIKFSTEQLPKKLGMATTPKPFDANAMQKKLLDDCNTLPADQQQALIAKMAIPYQVLADVRNMSASSTDIIFSGQSLDPYIPGFPWANGGIGTKVDLGPEAGVDAVVIGAPHPFTTSAWGTPMLSASLTLLRFTPNTSQKNVLQPNSFSSAWLDRPLTDAAGNISNPACFQKAPQGVKGPAVPKSDKDLLVAGCVGEGDVVAIITPHLYPNPNKPLEDQGKSRDLVVLSRSPMGEPKSSLSKIGYLTIYRRTDLVPDDASIFQDIWQFEKSVTNSQYGIPEPYGIAVVKNGDGPKATEGVATGSNKEQNGRYYIYYLANGMAEPKAVVIGGTTNAAQPGFGGFGPHRVYSRDFNLDKCGDIAITRAKISPDGKSIQFADYFDVHLQEKDPKGVCTGDFDAQGSKYAISPKDPKNSPQISSLAIADFNKDGHVDIMAGDFTTYMNNATKDRENFVYFLENMSGLFNTIQPTPYVVTTKNHSSDVGVIDLKSDVHANLGVVTGTPMMFAPLIPPPAIPQSACKTGVIHPVHSSLCSCGRDIDLDGVGDLYIDLNTFGKAPKISVALDCKKDAAGNFIYTELDLASKAAVTYTDCDGISTTATPRKLLIDWNHCDNCNYSIDTCTGPEASDQCKGSSGKFKCSDKCANPSQKDTDGDGYGDICTPGAPAPQANAPAPQANAPAPPPPQAKDNFAGSFPQTPAPPKSDPMPAVPQWEAKAVTFHLCGVTIKYCDLNLLVGGKCHDQSDTGGDIYWDKSWLCFPDPKVPSVMYDNDVDDDCVPDYVVVPANPLDTPMQHVDADKKCDSTPPPISRNGPHIREDKVLYADDQPVIAHQKDLQKAFTLINLKNDAGPEVTVLLNKTHVKGTPPPCQNGDLNCICQQNPDLQICKCLKDPAAPGCTTGPLPQVTCCLDVCRGDLTAPFGERQCGLVREKNDQFRKETGLCWDPFVPFEGAQYHISCTMTGAPALDLGEGRAYAQLFMEAGSAVPKNYFKDWHRPVANQNLLSKALLLNPAPEKTIGDLPLDLSPLPKPNFAFDAALSAVAPDAAVNQAPGITQIDGIMQIETYLADVDASTGAPLTKQAAAGLGAAAPIPVKALLLDIKGFSVPAPCLWKGDDCPTPELTLPIDAITPYIQTQIDKDKTAGKPVDLQTLNLAITEALKATGATSFATQKIVVNTSQGPLEMPMQYVSAGSAAEGGCGCSFSMPSSLHNTLLPVLMSFAAVSGMLVFRRKSAKKN